MTEQESVRLHFWIDAFKIASACKLVQKYLCSDGSPVVFSDLSGTADIALKEFDDRFPEVDEANDKIRSSA